MTRKKSTKKTKTKARLFSKPVLSVFAIAVVAGAIAYFSWPTTDTESSNPNNQAAQEGSGDKITEQKPAFDKNKYSTDEPASLWVIVNKGRQLPSTYSPSDLTVPDALLRYSSGSEMSLRADAATAIEKMFAGAKADDINLMVASGYRSYGLQSSVFNRYVSQLGQSEAEKISARPGHSEHQTGWAVDVAPASGQCLLEECFGDLAEGQWVAKNAHKYGFIVRYPDGMQKQTGYSYEPWHLRYIGNALAEEINDSPQTLEQFFGLPAFSSYPSDITELPS